MEISSKRPKRVDLKRHTKVWKEKEKRLLFKKLSPGQVAATVVVLTAFPSHCAVLALSPSHVATSPCPTQFSARRYTLQQTRVFLGRAHITISYLAASHTRRRTSTTSSRPVLNLTKLLTCKYAPAVVWPVRVVWAGAF